MKTLASFCTSRRRLVLFALILATVIGAIVVLVRDVVAKLDELATSSSDNVQWTLAQVEVDFGRFQIALLGADEPGGGSPEQLKDLRQRFDIFFSRVATLRNGSAYDALTRDAEFNDARTVVDGFLNQAVPLIDQSDSALLSAVETLEHQARQVGPQVRALTLRGVAVFAVLSDTRRESVAATLVRVGLLTVALILALLMAVIFLNRLFRLSQLQAEENRLTGDRLKTIISASLDAILVADGDGRVLDFNGAAAQIFGYEPAEAIGQLMTDLIFPPHLVEAHEKGMARFRATRNPRVIGKGRVQLQARRRDGTIFPVELSLDTANSADGEIYISFMRDISERVMIESDLRRARDDARSSDRAKADFLAVMSHEMRTPLNGLLGSIELLRDASLTERQAALLSTMETTGRLLLHHVNDVLDISGLETGKTRIEHAPFDLVDLVAQVVEAQRPLAQQRANKLSIVKMGALPQVVTGDVMRLKQVLINLLTNAVKFTQNGKITVELEQHTETAIGAQIEFRVIDTGIGIAEDQQERIFEDFVTLDASYGRDAEGTGLGLGIARRLTRAMGGDIGVESVEGAGSLFWVRLPLGQPAPALPAPPLAATEPMAPEASAVQIPKQPPAAAPEAPIPAQPEPTKAPPAPRAAAPSPTQLSILVVEDNQINRMIAREFLTTAGHRVSEAVDGIDGLSRAEDEEFDLILMDISMPRLDGLQCTRRIRAGHGPCCTVPIIALTAHAMPAEIDAFLAAGFNACLSKPVSRARLTDAIARAMSGEQQSPPAKADNADLLDQDQIADLIRALTADRATALLARFIEEADDTVTMLAEGHLRPGQPDTQPQVHKLAGSAGTFGARQLQTHLGRIESHLKSGAVLDAKLAMAAVAPVWARTRPLLAAHLQQPATAPH